MTLDATNTDGRRAIGHRNREAILAGALEVINRNPEAGVQEIADGVGVGRATLYRHFPTREDLLIALRERAREQGRAAMVAARLDDGDPLAVLERLVEALFEGRTRNRVLFDPAHGGKPSLAERKKFFMPVTKFFERAQRERILDAAVPATFLTAALRGLLEAAEAEVEAGHLRRADAPALIVRQLVDGAHMV